eukprot:jgi/Mesvir1/2045/Mv14788-RA.1
MALVEACRKGDAVAVESLLSAGEPVDHLVDRFDNTILHLAAAKGHVAVVDVLLDFGAALNARELMTLSTPLHKAAREGHATVVEHLLTAGGALDSENKSGNRPLHEAAETGSVEAMKVLLDAGARPDATNKLGLSPLHWASWMGHAAAARLLLDHGATISLRDEEGEAPLHYAAEYGQEEVLSLLLSAGAEVDPLNKNGNTPLLKAARNGHTECIRALLDGGANPLHQEQWGGWTALHLAAYKGHLAVAELLFERGASSCLAVRDKDGRTPRELAREKAVIDFLDAHANDLPAAPPAPAKGTLREYSAAQLDAATSSFANKVSEDALFEVWEGTLDGKLVAVKRARGVNSLAQMSLDKEAQVYAQEAARSCPYLSRLIGKCVSPDGHMASLVFERTAGARPLSDVLATDTGRAALPWSARVASLLHAARGLQCLHTAGSGRGADGADPTPLDDVHGAFTSAAILVTADGSHAQVQGVGAGRVSALALPAALLASRGSSSATGAARQGLPGGVTSLAYLDPQYLTSGTLSPASDVFALGVVALEMLTGAAPAAPGLVAAVQRRMSANAYASSDQGGEPSSGALDPSARWPADAATAVASLALRCTSLIPAGRPSLAADVIPALEGLLPEGSSARAPELAAPPAQVTKSNAGAATNADGSKPAASKPAPPPRPSEAAGKKLGLPDGAEKPAKEDVPDTEPKSVSSLIQRFQNAV